MQRLATPRLADTAPAFDPGAALPKRPPPSLTHFLALGFAVLGRRLLEGVATLVTPDTILAWHRRLVARK